MLTTRSTSWGGRGTPGLPTRSEAFADAVRAGVRAALDLLERRGVAWSGVRRRELIENAVRDAVAGRDIAFPRIGVRAVQWVECVSQSRADTSWVASVVVGYPIGLLRGDANNVRWERSRARNEAAVLRESAEENLAEGRLFEGLLDASSVAATVLGTGLPAEAEERPPLPEYDLPADDLARQEAELVNDELFNSLAWARASADVLATLTAEPLGGVLVVDRGSAGSGTVEFRCAYDWNGRAVPASGVPVRFETSGASAVLDSEPLTDGSGVARCRILAVYGGPGEYELELSLDDEAFAVVLEALGVGSGAPAGVPAGGAAAGTGARAVRFPAAPLARRTVHVVAGAHATTVCVDFGEGGDAAQAAAGFGRRMARDGFAVVDACGADVDVIVTGWVRVSVRKGVGPWAGFWFADAELTSSAFDQRTGASLGEFAVKAVERAESGKREAEVLALKEAGRLAAVRLGRLVLSARPWR